MQEKTLTRILYPLLFIYLFLYFFLPVEIEDIWWHLSIGRWITGHWQIPHQNVFSFGGSQVPWVVDHWLGSCIFYGIYQMGGIMGLKIFRAMFFVGIIAIFFLRYRKRLPVSVLVMLILILAQGLYMRCLLRPLIFNFVFIQLYLISLFAYQNDLERKRLAILLLAGILWANIHLGSFVYGTLIIGMFLLTTVIRYAGSCLTKKYSGDLIRIKRQVQDLTLFFIGFMLIMFLTPYGIEGFLFRFKVFLVPDYLGFYLTDKVIEEMLSPLILLNFASGFWALLIFTGGAAVLLMNTGLFFSHDIKESQVSLPAGRQVDGSSLKKVVIEGRTVNKKNNLTHLLLLAGSTMIFLRGIRGIEIFAVVGVYIIAEGLMPFDLLSSKWQFNPNFRSLNKYFCLIMILVFCAKIIILGRNVLWQRPYVTPNPVAAINFLKANKIEGNVFNTGAWGGYILWTSYPDVKPFLDGRQLQYQAFLSKYLEILNYPDQYWPEAEKKFQFNIALLDNLDPVLSQLKEYFKKNPTWRLAYRDEFSSVFVKGPASFFKRSQ